MRKSAITVPPKKLENTKAWKKTSELVRRKSKGVCYTCRKWFPFEKLSAGHFIEKIGHAATYFDLDNLRAQCSVRCNRMMHGAKDIYAKHLIDELGDGIIGELHNRSRPTKLWTKPELKKLADERERMLLELE